MRENHAKQVSENLTLFSRLSVLKTLHSLLEQVKSQGENDF